MRRPAGVAARVRIAKDTGLKSGSLYPILIRLADRGLVEARWEEEQPAGRPRRHPTGKVALHGFRRPAVNRDRPAELRVPGGRRRVRDADGFRPDEHGFRAFSGCLFPGPVAGIWCGLRRQAQPGQPGRTVPGAGFTGVTPRLAQA
jgi:Transcriptional regulator PadR-like family